MVVAALHKGGGRVLASFTERSSPEWGTCWALQDHRRWAATASGIGVALTSKSADLFDTNPHSKRDITFEVAFDAVSASRTVLLRLFTTRSISFLSLLSFMPIQSISLLSLLLFT